MARLGSGNELAGKPKFIILINSSRFNQVIKINNPWENMLSRFSNWKIL